VGIFVAWFLLWLAGSAFGPVQYQPPPDAPPSDIHESSESAGN
jgi:hypothetical protein